MTVTHLCLEGGNFPWQKKNGFIGDRGPPPESPSPKCQWPRPGPAKCHWHWHCSWAGHRDWRSSLNLKDGDRDGARVGQWHFGGRPGGPVPMSKAAGASIWHSDAASGMAAPGPGSESKLKVTCSGHCGTWHVAHGGVCQALPASATVTGHHDAMAAAWPP